MDTHTLVFGLSDEGDLLTGFKYDPKVLKSILFPVHQPSNKRRKIDGVDEQTTDVDVNADPDTLPDSDDKAERTWEIVLESPTERFLLSPSPTESGDDAEKSVNSPRRYKVSQIVERGSVSPDPAVNSDTTASVKPVEPPVEPPKPPPPTWSTPPAESNRTSTSLQIKGRSLSPEPTTKATSKPPRTKWLTQVLASDRGEEHIHFSADGISVEGVDASLGLKEISVRRWRRASQEEFITSCQ
ncbi:hypothetical protein PILCRDRAFT_179337 [Piloderma croceum F 1598]|uniref:Uncharacterized protein n=1 Tax=Piloderma croceum (strain F 1598) TaxID=765440 RepID=A0A0C3GI33_PILCF|nr:hypothetical protein PILCRDRAFT_179337 [Piloderma croceum F 1598]